MNAEPVILSRTDADARARRLRRLVVDARLRAASEDLARTALPGAEPSHGPWLVAAAIGGGVASTLGLLGMATGSGALATAGILALETALVLLGIFGAPFGWLVLAVGLCASHATRWVASDPVVTGPGALAVGGAVVAWGASAWRARRTRAWADACRRREVAEARTRVALGEQAATR